MVMKRDYESYNIYSVAIFLLLIIRNKVIRGLKVSVYEWISAVIKQELEKNNKYCQANSLLVEYSRDHAFHA